MNSPPTEDGEEEVNSKTVAVDELWFTAFCLSWGNVGGIQLDRVSKTTAVWQTACSSINMLHFLTNRSMRKSQEKLCHRRSGVSIEQILLVQLFFPLTNNTEAILVARLLQSKRPPNHTSKARQGLQ